MTIVFVVLAFSALLMMLVFICAIVAAGSARDSIRARVHADMQERERRFPGFIWPDQL